MWQFLEKDDIPSVSDAEDVTTTSDIHTPAEKMSEAQAENIPLKSAAWAAAKNKARKAH